MFEKGEEEELEKEESILKKEKKRYGERRKKKEESWRKKKTVHMDFYVHLSFATLRTQVLKTRIPSKNLST